jgi:hypothetical protein
MRLGSLQLHVMLADGSQCGVVAGYPFGEKLRMIVVGHRRGVLPVGQFLWLYIDVVEGDFAFMGNPELDDAFDAGMDGLIDPHDDIFAGLPFESSLTRNDIVGIDFLIAQHLHTM